MVERYQNVIRVGLSGHSHKEEIQIMQSMYSDDNLGINLVAGSLTTYENRNPSFSVYEFDAEHMIPVSSKTYYLDI